MPTIEQQLDTALEKIALVDTRTDSLIALFKTLKQQLAEALSGNITPAVQAKVDAIFTNLDAHAADVDAALTENTPA